MLFNKIKAYLNNYFKGSLNNLFFVFQNLFNKNFKNISNYDLESDIKKNDIWIFDSSSKLNKMSIFSAFSYLLSNELHKKNMKFSVLVCASGPGYCQVGASPKNPNNSMPCKACIKSNLDTFNQYDKILFSQSDNLIKNRVFDKNISTLIEPSKKWLARESRNIKVINQIEENLHQGAEKWINFLDKIGKNNLPKVAVIFNGYSFPESIIKNYLDNHGVTTFTFESGHLENSVFISKDHAPEYFFDFNKKELDSIKKKDLKNYMFRRTSGDFKRGAVNFWKKVLPISDELKNKFKKFDKVVSVFMNVPYDTSQTNASVLFENIYDWIDYLEVFIKNNKNIYFVFRSHPDELRPDKKSNFEISRYLENKGFNNYENVTLINSNLSINSYEIILNSDLVLTYNSTITLEAVYLGTNAINAGYAHFCRLDYFKISDTRESYKEKINFFLTNNQVEQETKDIISNYLYQMIFESSIDLSKNIKHVKKYEYQIYNKNILDKKFNEFIDKLEHTVR